MLGAPAFERGGRRHHRHRDVKLFAINVGNILWRAASLQTTIVMIVAMPRLSRSWKGTASGIGASNS